MARACSWRCETASTVKVAMPHGHHRQAYTRRFPLAQPVVELPHARFRAILPAEPDRTTPDQIAHHNTVGVAPLDRYLVDTDGLRSWLAGLGQLRRHVLLLQRLDGIPVQLQLLGNVLDRPRAAAPPHVVGKALGIEGMVGQEIELLAFHAPAALALHAPNLELQIHAPVAVGQIARLAHTSVVPSAVKATAAATHRFFERRTRGMTQAFGSPKTPHTVGSGCKPGNAYASQSRRFRRDELAIGISCTNSRVIHMPQSKHRRGSPLN